MNFMDYCDWRGDLVFEADPYNEVDALLFAFLSYTDLTDCVPKNEYIELSKAVELYFTRHSEEEIAKSKSFVAASPIVMRKMASCNRFKNVKLHHYVNDVRFDDDVQFSAVSADLNDKETVIAYCGTDDSLVGWKEDLQLSYKRIKAQPMAKAYLEMYSASGRMYHLTGHSKGGNLALYAACKCSKILQELLIDIYDFDGPGLNEFSFVTDEYDMISDRYHKFVPESSVFGMIYNNSDDLQIVRSSEVMLLQHAAQSWQIMGNRFERIENRSDYSFLMENTLIGFLERESYKRREDFVETLFVMMGKAGILNVSEIQEKGIPLILRLLKIMKEREDLFKEIQSDFVDSFLDATKTEAKNRIDARWTETTKRFNTVKNTSLKMTEVQSKDGTRKKSE